jgi:hypothetical protein
MVFDTRTRIYEGPRDPGESLFAFLDRSGRPLFDAARCRIDDWYSRLCDSLKEEVRQRLRSGDDRRFDAAFWELYLHELFTRLGYEISCEQPLPNGRKIDFLLRRGDAAFYLEATATGMSNEQRGADARRDRIYRELNRVRTTAFMLGISIDQAGPGDAPRLARLRDDLEAWLAGLDPDEVVPQWEAHGEVPSYPWLGGGGWAITFDAIPSKPEARGRPADRALGIFVDYTVPAVRGETPLLHALKDKQPRGYGDDLPLPYVVAVNETSLSSFGSPEPHRANVMFGTLEPGYVAGSTLQWVRKENGFWRGPGAHPRNRRLAAVLFTSGLTPWTTGQAELEWWDNPFASQPVAEELIPDVAARRRLRPDHTGEINMDAVQPTRTPGSVLDPQALQRLDHGSAGHGRLDDHRVARALHRDRPPVRWPRQPIRQGLFRRGLPPYTGNLAGGSTACPLPSLVRPRRRGNEDKGQRLAEHLVIAFVGVGAWERSPGSGTR